MTNIATAGNASQTYSGDFIGLVGDIGGTNARFALAQRTATKTDLIEFKQLECAKYDNVYAAIADYFVQIGRKPKLDYATLAVAGPVKDGEMKFTNLSWVVREDELKKVTEARHALLVNDYAGLAFALPHLQDSDIKRVGSITKGTGNVYAVMGAGTGFGASVLVGGRHGPYCLSTESGHASFAPVNDFEADIHKFLRRKFGRVTIEMLMSGPGLVNLYNAICFVRGEKAVLVTPAEITNLEGADAQGCRHTVEAFLDILASVTGDMALLHGATAGMFIAGGVAPRLIKYLDELRFRARMEAKAPMVSMVAAIPSSIITHQYAALIGAAHTLTDQALSL